MLRDSDQRDHYGSDGQHHRHHAGARSLARFDGHEAPALWLDSEDSDRSAFDLSLYWRLLLKHRWVIAGCLIGSIALGIAITLLMTPIYKANATLQIDREAAKVVKSDELQPSEQMIAGDEFFQTQYGLLKSKSLATRVIDNLNLASDDRFVNTMGAKVTVSAAAAAASPAAEAKRRREILEVFQKSLSVSPVRGSRLVEVAFESPDPAMAAQIANAISENFIASNLDRRFESSAYARQFLEERLAQLKIKLEESERAVVAYAERQEIINVSPSGDSAPPGAQQSLTTSTLVSLNNALSAARGERIKAEMRWKQSQSAGSALTEALQNPTVQELSQTKAKLQSEYQDKLSIYKADYPEMQQLRSRIAELDKQTKSEIANIQGSLQMQYSIALAQERAFEGQVNRLKSSVLDLRDRSIQYEILQREVDTSRTLYDGLLQRYKEIGVAGGVSTNNVSIVDKATPPDEPSKPKPLLNIALAALAGLALGVVVAIFLELLDESVTTPEDVENKLGLTLLGSVPRIDKGQRPLIAMDDPRSPISEAYYSIRTALQFSTAEGTPSPLVVTSSRPAEGKSTTALAISKGFARLGLRVLLVDGDLRNPSMHRNIGIENDVGFSNFLTGRASMEEVVHPTSDNNLSFIPCGPLPPNPAELLSGAKLQAFLRAAREGWDMVIIDGPPVMGLADAPLFAAHVAGTLFVLESGGTRRGVARTAIRRLQMGRGRVIGAVLTKFDAKRASYGAGYAYSYEYEYGTRPQISGNN